MTMKTNFFRLAALGVAVAGVTAAAALAQGLDASSLRASGKAGETADGFMACRASCDAATEAAIKAINDRRAALYRETANDLKVSAAAAGASSFQNRLACTGVPRDTCIKAGEYYRPAGGGWVRK